MSKFTEEIFTTICDRIATSSDGLVKICKEQNISAVSFYSWVKSDPELLNRYTRAREDQADFLADQIIEIADDSTYDTKIIETKGGPLEIENTEWTNRSKLRVEARKWVAAKLKPKKYGDKLDVNQKIQVEQPLFGKEDKKG